MPTVSPPNRHHYVIMDNGLYHTTVLPFTVISAEGLLWVEWHIPKSNQVSSTSCIVRKYVCVRAHANYMT